MEGSTCYCTFIDAKSRLQLRYRGPRRVRIMAAQATIAERPVPPKGRLSFPGAARPRRAPGQAWHAPHRRSLSQTPLSTSKLATRSPAARAARSEGLRIAGGRSWRSLRDGFSATMRLRWSCLRLAAWSLRTRLRLCSTTSRVWTMRRSGAASPARITPFRHGQSTSRRSARHGGELGDELKPTPRHREARCR